PAGLARWAWRQILCPNSDAAALRPSAGGRSAAPAAALANHPLHREPGVCGHQASAARLCLPEPRVCRPRLPASLGPASAVRSAPSWLVRAALPLGLPAVRIPGTGVQSDEPGGRGPGLGASPALCCCPCVVRLAAAVVERRRGGGVCPAGGAGPGRLVAGT